MNTIFIGMLMCGIMVNLTIAPPPIGSCAAFAGVPRVTDPLEAVPFSYQLPNNMDVGTSVLIVGTPNTDTHAKIAIRFGEHDVSPDGNNYSFSFAIRYDEGPLVLMNTKTDGYWGDEERYLDFQPATADQIGVQIIATTDGYYIVVATIFQEVKYFFDYRGSSIADFSQLYLDGDWVVQQISQWSD